MIARRYWYSEDTHVPSTSHSSATQVGATVSSKHNSVMLAVTDRQYHIYCH